MRKERRNLLLAGLMAIAVVGGLAWLVFSSHEPPEPVYQGMRLSEWLLRGADGTSNHGAAQAVRHIGTNAIPTLLRMLRAHDSKLKLKLIGLAQEQRLIKINFVSANQRNMVAARGFLFLGPAASNAVPALIQIYEENISQDSQVSTASALNYIRPASSAAVPAFLRTVTDTNANKEVRVVTAQVLGSLHTEPELVVPVLIKCLKDSERRVQFFAAAALLSFGKDASTAVPALVDLLKDPDPDVRGIAELALKAIDPEAAVKAGVK